MFHKNLTPVSGPVPDDKRPKLNELWESEWDVIHITRYVDSDPQCLEFTVTKVKKQPDAGSTRVGMKVVLLAEDIVLDYSKVL